nr:MAG TPA: hypothetical protein [Caudoviricetes sp.]
MKTKKYVRKPKREIPRGRKYHKKPRKLELI